MTGDLKLASTGETTLPSNFTCINRLILVRQGSLSGPQTIANELRETDKTVIGVSIKDIIIGCPSDGQKSLTINYPDQTMNEYLDQIPENEDNHKRSGFESTLKSLKGIIPGQIIIATEMVLTGTTEDGQQQYQVVHEPTAANSVIGIIQAN